MTFEPLQQENVRYCLLLIDEDPTFRLGLRLWLNQQPHLQVVAETENGAIALDLLRQYYGDPPDSAPTADHPDSIDLVILDVGLGRIDTSQIQGLELCQQIRNRYPALPILLLSSLPEPVVLAAAQQAGATGYCPKSMSAAELVKVVQQVARGQSQWRPVSPLSEPPITAANLAPESPDVNQPGALAIARRNLRLASYRRINVALAEIDAQLQDINLSSLNRAVLAGRRRELLAARWLIERLLATPALPPSPPTPPPPSSPLRPTPDSGGAIQRAEAPTLTAPTGETATITARSLQAVLFDRVLAKLPGNLSNQTDVPLETDILREDKKRELLYIALRKLEELLDELRFSQVQIDQLQEKRSLILQDLWLAVLIDFYGKYYTLTIANVDIEVVGILQREIGLVQDAILNKIPFVPDLLAHLLFQTPLLIDSIPYRAGSPDAIARAELLLEHLLVQVANGVVQPLINRFGDVEAIKQNFYDRRLLSSREIERFRNNLSWRYRLDRLVKEPQDIFQSQYRLLRLTEWGMRLTSIYAPRGEELQNLDGIPFAITLALEARDAIAPRLRSAVAVVGGGVVYILTEVIGRGIGLIGKGILKGIGNAWQDTRPGRR